MRADDGDRLDPARSMRLLFRLERSPRRPGPRPRLDLDDIVTTAIELADERGLDAVTMRSLAEQLGVGAMTLYGYVQAKGDLYDLMYDRIVGEASTTRPDDPGPEGSWRDRLEAVARQRWTLHHEHPWFSHMPMARPPLGPNVLRAFEDGLATLDGLGLGGRARSDILSAVSAYVDGAARVVMEARTLPDETGLDDQAWWDAVAPIFDEILTPEDFPLLSSPTMADAWELPDDDQGYVLAEALAAFEFGLQRLLDGIEAWVEARA